MTPDRDRIRRAIALVTAAHTDAEPGPGQQLAEDFPTTGEQGLIDTTMGLVDLCGLLLLDHRTATGTPVLAHLQDLARRISAEE